MPMPGSASAPGGTGVSWSSGTSSAGSWHNAMGVCDYNGVTDPPRFQVTPDGADEPDGTWVVINDSFWTQDVNPVSKWSICVSISGIGGCFNQWAVEPGAYSYGDTLSAPAVYVDVVDTGSCPANLPLFNAAAQCCCIVNIGGGCNFNGTAYTGTFDCNGNCVQCSGCLYFNGTECAENNNACTGACGVCTANGNAGTCGPGDDTCPSGQVCQDTGSGDYECAAGSGGGNPSCPSGETYVNGSCQAASGCEYNSGWTCGCNGTVQCNGECVENGNYLINGECCYGSCASNCGSSDGGCGYINCNGGDDTSGCPAGNACGNSESCSQDSDCGGGDYLCEGGCCTFDQNYGGGSGDPCSGDGCETYYYCNAGCDQNCDCASDYEDPLVIDVSGKGFLFTDVAHGVRFDMLDDGTRIQTAWTAAQSDVGFLALDRNNNGRIDDSSELFSNTTPQPAKGNNRSGFVALAYYDQPEMGGNRDGVIDEKDAVYSKLLVWVDKNHDGISQPGELFTLKELGIKSISVEYEKANMTDIYGNRMRYRSKIVWEKQPVNWMYDVDLRIDDSGSGAGSGNH